MTEAIEIGYNDITIRGEYRSGSPLVIFSHGFGVQRDSRGMFSQLAAALPEDFGYILFDYNEISGTDVKVEPYSRQIQKLDLITKFAREKSSEVYLIGHSMGCITACILGFKYDRTVFLAPPVHRLKPAKQGNRWEGYPGAHWQDDILIVPRRDGTTTHMPKAFFEEARDISAFEQIVLYSQINPITIIEALQEDILADTVNYRDLPKANIELLAIPGDHNFSGPDRVNSVELVLELIRPA